MRRNRFNTVHRFQRLQFHRSFNSIMKDPLLPLARAIAPSPPPLSIPLPLSRLEVPSTPSIQGPPPLIMPGPGPQGLVSWHLQERRRWADNGGGLRRTRRRGRHSVPDSPACAETYQGVGPTWSGAPDRTNTFPSGPAEPRLAGQHGGVEVDNAALRYFTTEASARGGFRAADSDESSDPTPTLT
jgi:hypothetical protein